MNQQEIDAGLDALYEAITSKPRPVVVLIEDDDNDVDLFRFALKRVARDVEFMHFENGNQALDFFSGKGCYADRERFPLPQLTVLDLNLVGSHGLSILHEIRSAAHSEGLIVVALTGSEDLREIEVARALLIDGWVNKPERAEDLVVIVRWLLRTWLPSAL